MPRNPNTHRRLWAYLRGSQWLRYSWLNLSIILFCGLLFLLEQHWGVTQLSQLGLQPKAIRTQNTWWQVLSGHFLHFTPYHLFWNLAALALLTVIFEKEQAWQEDLIYLFGGSIFVGTLLHFFVPNLNEYRGLSGILYGLTTYYALKCYASQKYFALMILLFLTGRILWQYSPFFDQDTAIDKLGGQISAEAHLFGYASAFIGFAVRKLILTR